MRMWYRINTKERNISRMAPCELDKEKQNILKKTLYISIYI